MTSHSETRIVPYTADLMFRVVADVRKYPRFLPWVTDLDVLRHEGTDHGREALIARMSVGFARFRESYTSRVTLDEAARTVDVVQIDGPFRVLENYWRFTPEGEGSCRVDFAIEYEFKSMLLNLAAGAAFDRVARRMADAFEARAAKLARKQARDQG
jgi:coenzyme Q-binding protein COQ10